MSNGQTPVQLQVDGAVATLTLDRPASFNAIDLPMVQALRTALQQAAALPALRVLLLQGSGRSFCGGGDIMAMQAHQGDLPGFVGQVIDGFHDCMLLLARLPLPVVAAVQGAAAGGGFSLVLAADLAVAARSARFVVAYPQLGTSTDGGLSFRLQQRLGPSRALEVLTVNGTLSAEQAQAMGLLNAVVDDDALQGHAQRWAQQLAALPAQAVQELKGLTVAPSLAALHEHLLREKEAFLRCAATPEFAARVQAFAQRSQRR